MIKDHDLMRDRFLAASRHLEAQGAVLLPMWSYLHAATHALNAGLHRVGVTVEADEAASNHAGRYLNAQGQPATVHRRVADVIHTDMPPVDVPRSRSWLQIMTEIEQVEVAAAAAMRSDWNPRAADVARIRDHVDSACQLLDTMARDAQSGSEELHDQ